MKTIAQHALVPASSLRKAVAGALGALFLAGGATAALAQETTFRVSLQTPEPQTMSVAIKRWGDEITRQTGGKIKFQYFWSSSLLPALESATGIKDGRAQVGMTAAAYQPSRMPLATIDTLPFVTNNIAAFGRAFFETYKQSPALREEFAANDLHMVAFIPAAGQIIYSKTPIKGVDDLKNMRVRAIGLGVDALRAVGANPVALPVDQVYDALSKGLLGAASGSTLDLGVAFGFHTVAPNIIDTNYGTYASSMLAINRNIYEKMDAQTKAVFDQVGEKFLPEYYLPELRKALEESCNKAKAAGAKVSVWASAETDKWRNALGDAGKKRWIENVSKSTKVDAAKFLAEYEARVHAFEKTSPWTNPAQACQNG